MTKLSAVAGAAGQRRGSFPAVPTPRALFTWAIQHREALWMVVLALIAVLAHGYNMFHFPYYESDEGTYMSQAWAIARLGKLAPYTYWYDHAPVGWLQIAVWATLTGGFYTFGSPVNSGRVLMLLLHLGSTVLVYQIARGASRGSSRIGLLAPTIAALTFGLSAYGIYYHRRVLLDNIATFWMLLSIALLIHPRLSLKRVWFSGLALGISILSKELTIFLVPVLAYLAFFRADRSQRWLAIIGWTTMVGAVVSTYALMAILKGELFPSGTWLGGTHDHVSLIGTLQYQSSRERDAGLLDFNSNVWSAIRNWRDEEPLLLIGGSVAAILSLLVAKWWRLIGILGAATLSLWAFLGRGGVTLPFYLVPLLPLLAINLGLVVGLMVGGVCRLLHGLSSGGNRLTRLLGRGIQTGAVAACLAGLPIGYHNPHLEFRSDPLVLWRSKQADVHKQVADWVIQNIPRDSTIIIDQSLYLELHEIPGQKEAFERAHYYWKVKEDPEVREGVFKADWKTVDYVITTNQLIGDANRIKDPITLGALEHSTLLKSFDTGGWPIEVRQVHSPYQEQEAAAILLKTWEYYRAHFIEQGRVIDQGRSDKRTTSEAQSYAMLRAVYIDDHKTFDEVWAWTKANLQQEDGVLTWHWQPSDDPKRQRDFGSATDADQDTALALLLASKRWNEPRYRQDARKILNGIWEKETTVINGRRVAVAGNWARGDVQGSNAVINPSYFAPYAYRIFAEADPRRPWIELVDTTYEILETIRTTPQFSGPHGLVPNWLELDIRNGALREATYFGGYANEFSYDAGRVPWRLAVDWLWFNDVRARRALDGLNFLQQAYERDGKIFAAYRIDSTWHAEHESLSMYAGAMGNLMFSLDRELPYEVYTRKIASAYRQTDDGAYWGDPNNYYDQNWAWFAAALVNGTFENLWEKP